MTTTAPYDPGQIKALRAEMRHNGEKLTSGQIWGILRTTGDYDLALTALVMTPRPAWVTKLLATRA